MSLFQIILILSSVLATSLLSGIVGMAGDALLLVILGFALLPVQQSVALYATALFFACASRACIHRKHLPRRSMEYYFVGLFFVFVFGSLPGIALDKTTQDLLLGIGSLLLGVAFFVPFFSLGKIRPDFCKPPQALLCAVLTAGFKAIDDRGFLLNLFFQDIPLTRYQVIGAKAAAQLIPCLIIFVHSGAAILSASDIPPELFWICLAVIPVAISGSVLAKHILHRLTDAQFYKTTQVILWLMGAIYIAKAALLLMQVVPQLLTPGKI